MTNRMTLLLALLGMSGLQIVIGVWTWVRWTSQLVF